MKKLTLLTLLGLSLLTSCGKDIHHQHETKTETKTVETTVELLEPFEGEHYLANNGFIELYQNGDSVLISTSYQLLTTINPDNSTFAELPRISGELTLQDNKLRITRNLNYTAGQDVEEDVGGNNILGQRRTDVTIELINDKLQITYKIYSDKIGNNANYIVATRILTGE